jgi:ribosomal protein S18 acetylase RimI-like enzyme
MVVGAVILRHAGQGSSARLGWLAVVPDARGRGVGQLLLSNAIEAALANGAVELRAMVEPANTPMLALLESFGFLRDGVSPDRRLALWHRRAGRPARLEARS